MLQTILDFGKVQLLDKEFQRCVYGYGLMLVLGFLCAIYLTRWRLKRMGENPDIAMHIGMISLVGGVAGARIAYIIQKWPEFMAAPNPLLAMVNITSGGLIYYGGLVLGMLMVVAYLFIKRLPARRMLDAVAPTIMIGLAFGRMGCLLNGCCFGGLCDTNWPLAMHFPMYSQPLLKLDGSPGPFSCGTDHPSPAYEFQYIHGDIVPDDRLTLQVGPYRGLHSPRYLHGALTNDQLAVMQGSKSDAEKLFKQSAPSDTIDEDGWQQLRDDGKGLLRGSEFWDEAVAFSNRSDANSRKPVLGFNEVWNYLLARKEMLLNKFDADHDGKLTGAECDAANRYLQSDLYDLAAHQHALAVRPSQALGVVNGLLLGLLLMLFHRLRNREGQVFALTLMLYPITRFFEELIRADNPHDLTQLELTHNQYTSIIMFVAGIVLWMVLRRFRPSAGPTWAQRLAAPGSKR